MKLVLKIFLLTAFLLGLYLLWVFIGTPDRAIEVQVQGETQHYQKTILSTVLKSRKMEDYIKAGAVGKIRIEARPDQIFAEPVFETIKAKPTLKGNPHKVPGQFLDSERSTYKGNEGFVDTCVQNCAQYLLPLDGIEFKKDSQGAIRFPIFR